ncbi:MAG: SPFH domain-containing protein [Acidimicrobiales bacterium]|jgi:membrane protease subunit (stomatin/prohibitin family)|nr:SPFH domain-containing protein [Acidimicrobiales bacterium]
MGFLRDEVARQFIAVPDDKKDQIVYKWPDINIRKGARAIVEADAVAVFMNKGEVLGTLGPGQHRLDADEIMFLGIVIDWATDGNAYRAEIFFCGTRQYTGQTFGGRIDNVQDPQTGMIITLRVFGDYAMQVVDPTKLILKLTGTVNVENNQDITYWMSQQLLKVMRTEITRQIVRNGWPLLGLSAYTPEIEAAVIAAANNELADYGIAITRMGNFDINLDEEDENLLKGFQKDTAYSRLAGSFQQYAAGQAMLGAGEGMAQGGGAATQGAFLATGLGVGGAMGGAMTGGYPVGPTPPPPPGAGGPGYYPQQPVGPGGGGGAAMCANCGVANAPGARFCASCGTPVAAPASVYCQNCGTEIVGGARFCSSCGTPAPAPAPAAAPAATAAAPAPAAADPYAQQAAAAAYAQQADPYAQQPAYPQQAAPAAPPAADPYAQQQAYPPQAAPAYPPQAAPAYPPAPPGVDPAAPQPPAYPPTPPGVDPATQQAPPAPEQPTPPAGA